MLDISVFPSVIIQIGLHTCEPKVTVLHFCKHHLRSERSDFAFSRSSSNLNNTGEDQLDSSRVQVPEHHHRNSTQTKHGPCCPTQQSKWSCRNGSSQGKASERNRAKNTGLVGDWRLAVAKDAGYIVCPLNLAAVALPV